MRFFYFFFFICFLFNNSLYSQSWKDSKPSWKELSKTSNEEKEEEFPVKEEAPLEKKMDNVPPPPPPPPPPPEEEVDIYEDEDEDEEEEEIESSNKEEIVEEKIIDMSKFRDVKALKNLEKKLSGLDYKLEEQNNKIAASKANIKNFRDALTKFKKEIGQKKVDKIYKKLEKGKKLKAKDLEVKMFIDDIKAQIRKEEEVIWNAEESIKIIKDDQFTTRSEIDYINRKPAYIVGKEYDDSYYKSVYFQLDEKGNKAPIVEEIEYDEELDEYFMVVEVMPTWPGCDIGDDACTQIGMVKFLQKNVKYPAIAKEYNITGKVYVQFIIDRNGDVTDVKVIRGVDKHLDNEALRVVKSFPRFTPGRQLGKKVRVMYTVPLNFNLN